ncbi:MAG: type 12 methyltransferase [Parcubacteria group bacterium Gr01-1014_106]|nr:MAG: type 12 methyltransferase [Parcubacteria group bacterium Gr01-1014_106]
MPHSPRPSAKPVPWQLQVFRVSVRKREKWSWVTRALRDHGLPRGQCLDIGCGVGTLSILLEKAGGAWTFLEPEREAAAEAAKILRGSVRTELLHAAGFPAASFALVTAFDVLEHVPDPTALLTEIARVLEPGGFFLATTPAAGEGNYLWRSLGERAFGITKESHGHVVEGFSKQALQPLLRDVGLHATVLEPFSKFFTEAVELAYNGAYFLNNARRQQTTGYNLALSPASSADVRRHAWAFPLLRVAAPFLRGISLLDGVLPLGPGYEYGIVAMKPYAGRAPGNE